MSKNKNEERYTRGLAQIGLETQKKELELKIAALPFSSSSDNVPRRRNFHPIS